MSNYSDSKFSEDPNSSWYKVFNYIKPNSKVLDVGCSSGTFGKILIEKKSCVVDGVELDTGDYKKAKKVLRNVYQLNIETDDLSDIEEKYDFIYFGDVVEHLVTPGKSLSRVRSLLNPTGEIVFSIPNMSHLSVRMMLLKGDFTYGNTGLLDKTHLHFYNHKEVERVFGEGGYEIIHLDPVLKDWPKELVTKELADVGLKFSSDFLNFTKTTEASVYQFVGAAKPTNDKIEHKPLDISSPVDKFQTLLDLTIEHYEDRLKSQSEHIKKLEEYAKEQAILHQQVKEEFEHLKQGRNVNPRGIARIAKSKVKKAIKK